MAEKLYILDGHSQMFRAYWARTPELTSPAGEPTKATYVFCTMLLKLINERKPAYLAMAIDGPRDKLLRRRRYDQYKITREPTPEDFHPQARRIVEIVGKMGIPILQAEGYEADDILATAAARLAGADMDLVLVSRDKDLDQLVGPHVALFDPMKNETLDAAAIEREKGYPPGKAVEVQTLMGDATDNIPGVPGVGPKTAAKLIAKYGSAEAVLAHADEQTPKLRENLQATGAEGLKLARDLVTLNRDVPMDLSPATLRFAGVDLEAVRPIFEELGFRRLIDQLEAAKAAGLGWQGTTPHEPSARSQGLGDGDRHRSGELHAASEPVPAAEAADAGETPAGRTGETPMPPPEAGPTGGTPVPPPPTTAADFRYTTIDTPEALAGLAAELATVKRLSVDTETTSIRPMQAELVGISLAWRPGEAVYIPVAGPLGARTLEVEQVRRALGPVLADPAVAKVGQNLKYDMLVLGEADMPLLGAAFDTMVAAHVLDSTRMSYKMDALAAEYINHRSIPISDLIGKGKGQLRMNAVPVDVVTRYAAEDADVALRLADVLQAKLAAEEGLDELFTNLEMPLVPVLADMERLGVLVDVAVLNRQEAALSKQADALRERIVELAGHPFNVDSPRQLALVLFEEKGLKSTKQTKTGLSTDSSVLEELAIENELPRLVLDYRKLTKLIGTYLKALATFINPRTGRVHTSFHQAGTATGRLSSSDPNLQNIPIRTEQGREIRSAFVAAPGYVLLSADYSQVELRVLAHLCGDPTLAEAFAAGQDIHRAVAAEVFAVPLEQVTPEQRARAKTVNFGIIYGQTAFGLSVALRIPRQDAADFIARYRARFRRIDEFLAECVAAAKRQGYVETIFGRRRRIADIESSNPQRRALAERLAINSVVQGSAADLIKQAMVNIARRIRQEHRPSRMLLQIHDELVFEVPPEAVGAEREMIVEEMTGAVRMKVPLKVDVGVGPNWMEAK